MIIDPIILRAAAVLSDKDDVVYIIPKYSVITTHLHPSDLLAV